jgi:hypothetical protein
MMMKSSLKRLRPANKNNPNKNSQSALPWLFF